MRGVAIEPLIAPHEAAQILGIEVTTLEKWRCTKRYGLPFVKVGRLVRYRVGDIEAFIASRTVG
jgi:excisionase family DNA binding protein